MAAPTVAAVSSGNSNSGSYAVSVPAGTTNGDLLIAIAASDWGTFAGNDIPAAFKTGTGGITLGTSDYDAGTNAFHIALGARIASSEPASYTFSHDSSDHVAAIIRVTGHDSTPVIVEVAPRTIGTGTEAPSLVPNGSDDLLICIFGAETSSGGARTWTPPTGMTEHVDRQSTTWTTLLVASLQNPSNPSGIKTATPSAAVDTGAGCTISIKAAGASGTNLVIQDALHAQTADNIDITQVHSLAVQDSAQAQTVDNLTLTNIIDLAIQKAVQATKTTAIDFTQVHQLAINNAFMNTKATVVNFLEDTVSIDNYSSQVGFRNRGGSRSSILSTDPAAGAEISYTVPNNRGFLLELVRFRLVTSAVVANRVVTLTIDDNDGNTVAEFCPGVNQAASLTVDYVFASNIGYAQAAIANSKLLMGIVPLYLPSGWTVRTVTTAKDVGDNFGAAVLTGEEYI